jgi:hypothetical protein
MNAQEFLRYVKNPAALDASSLPLMQTLVREYPWFRTGWILYLKNLEILQDSDYQSVLHQTALRVTDRKWLKNMIEGHHRKERDTEMQEDYQLDISDMPEGELPSDKARKSEKTKLIESFLEQGATFKTSLQGEQNEQPVDLAARAVAINDDIVTEKFANLLLRQSKFEEAMEAFEKLSLKYPEKSIYFAARIEEVKKLLNINKI